MDRHMPGKHRFPLIPDKPALHRRQQQHCTSVGETPLQRCHHGPKRSEPSWAVLCPLDTLFGWLQLTLPQRPLPMTASTRTEQPPKPSAGCLTPCSVLLSSSTSRRAACMATTQGIPQKERGRDTSRIEESPVAVWGSSRIPQGQPGCLPGSKIPQKNRSHLL